MPLTMLPLVAFLFGTPLSALAVAVGAAAIPVVIHLLNRRRFRVVTWAAMRFLLAAQRKNTRRMHLEQLILLAVRTLVVLLLVLAMASVMPWAEQLWQRWLPDNAVRAAGGSRRTHHILVLDGSFSMGLKVGDRTCFERACSLAEQILHEAPGGDGFSVLLMCAPPRRIVPEPSEDAGRVRREIKALHLPHGNADLVATLQAVEDMLRRSPPKFDHREVYFFTDLQRSTWTARPGADPAPVLDKIRNRAQTILVDVGQDGAANLAVTDLALGEALATAGRPTTVTARIHNFGTDVRRKVRAELWVGKARATAADPPVELRLTAQAVVDVDRGQEPLAFEHKFGTPGDYVAQVRLENDALELDDVRSMVVRVKETLPVLLVNGKPDAEPLKEATEWLHLALNPFPTGLVPRDVPARPEVMTESRFATATDEVLAPYDCIFLCDVERLSAGEVRRLETHLRRGGGVVFCLGPQVDAEAYNRLLYRNGEGILPGRLLGRQRAPDKAFFHLYPEGDTWLPPLAAFAAESDRASLRAARFRQYLRVEMPPADRARKVLSFKPEVAVPGGAPAAEAPPVGDPALLEWSRYRGRVVLFTSTVNLDWTTWPASPSFPPLMQEVLHFAVAGRLREQAVGVGDVLEEFLPAGGGEREYAVLTPDKRTESGRTQEREEASVLRWTDTDVSGIYRATIGHHPQEYLFAVNVPTATADQQSSESDLTRTNAEELQALSRDWDFQVVTDPRAVVHSGGLPAEGSSALGRGLGSVVARWLLLAMLLLVLVEVVLAWQFGHYSGTGTSSEAPPAPGRLVPGTIAGLAGALVLTLTGVLGHAAWTGDFLGFLPDGLRGAVEAGIGVPPPAPGEGTRWYLEFSSYLYNAGADPWLAVLISLGATGMVVLVYLQEGRTSSVPYKLLLAGLRVSLVLFTLAVLLPQVRLWFERQGWPDVALVIDDSQSMSHVDRYQDEQVREAAGKLGALLSLSTPDRLRLAEALVSRGEPNWLETLLTRRRVKVHVYHCSDRAARLSAGTALTEPDQLAEAAQAIQGLQAQGKSSQLGTAVRQVLNDFRGSSLAAVVLLTDGVTTEGEDLAKVSRYAAQAGVPLYFVGIGDAQEVRDLQLHDLQVDDAVYVNDRLVFEGRLTGQGYKNLEVPVTLREKGQDRVLARQQVKVDAQGQPVKFRLSHRPTEPGEKTYVLEVPEQADEVKPADNNTLERQVFVREAKVLKVLYVDGYARYDYRFLKNLLERESAQDKRNKTIDLKVVLLDADDQFPEIDRSALADFPRTKTELNQFDVVLFGDVDPRHPKLDDKKLRDLADFVRERGGGFLMQAGERHSPHAYKDSPLRDILPIEVLRDPTPEEPERGRIDGFRPELTPVGRMHPIFRFSPDEKENDALWSSLPELYWWSEGYRVKPAAEVLAVHPKQPGEDPRVGGTRAEGHPLAVQQFVGAGRCLFLGLNETYRWRYREHERHFNQFWIQTVRYLARSRQGRVDLRLDRQTPYRRGEPIRVTVRFPDDAPPLAPGAEVKVVAERSLSPAGGRADTEVQTLRLAKLEGSRATYESVLTRTPEGDYRFWLSVPSLPSPKPRAECRVLAPPGELDRLQMNQKEMEQAAQETRGRFYTLADAHRLPDDLPAGARVALNTPQPPRLLWNQGPLFAVALFFLVSEWVLRKRKHLL